MARFTYSKLLLLGNQPQNIELRITTLTEQLDIAEKQIIGAKVGNYTILDNIVFRPCLGKMMESKAHE